MTDGSCIRGQFSLSQNLVHTEASLLHPEATTGTVSHKVFNRASD
jgi:hypothetical protein